MLGMAACLVASVLAVVPAVAQTAGSGSGAGGGAAGSGPAPPPGAAASDTGGAAGGGGAGTTGNFIDRRSNVRVGEVNDVLLDRNGQVVAIIVGAGGLLGIGEWEVAIPFSQVEFTLRNQGGGGAGGGTGVAGGEAAGGGSAVAGGDAAGGGVGGNAGQPDQIKIRKSPDDLSNAPRLCAPAVPGAVAEPAGSAQALVALAVPRLAAVLVDPAERDSNAALSPLWSSAMTSFTPRKPRSASARRNAVQNGSASEGGGDAEYLAAPIRVHADRDYHRR